MDREVASKRAHHPISAEEQRLLCKHGESYAGAGAKRRKEVLEEAVADLSRRNPIWTVRTVTKWFHDNGYKNRRQRKEEKYWHESLHAVRLSEVKDDPDQVLIFLGKRKTPKVDSSCSKDLPVLAETGSDTGVGPFSDACEDPCSDFDDLDLARWE